MVDFGTYQGALAVFQNARLAGATENCIIGAIVDYSKSSEFTITMVGHGAAGPLGYLVGSAVGYEKDERIRRINDFTFTLVDFTEAGIGFVPLRGAAMKINPEKHTPCYSDCFFFPYQEIAEITVKNFFGIRKTVKSIKIKLVNGKKLFFNANMTEKTLPYQAIGMQQIVARYQK